MSNNRGKKILNQFTFKRLQKEGYLCTSRAESENFVSRKFNQTIFGIGLIRKRLGRIVCVSLREVWLERNMLCLWLFQMVCWSCCNVRYFEIRYFRFLSSICFFLLDSRENNTLFTLRHTYLVLHFWLDILFVSRQQRLLTLTPLTHFSEGTEVQKSISKSTLVTLPTSPRLLF